MKEWTVEGKVLAIVHWTDAMSSDDLLEDEITRDCPRVTVGWLLADDEDGVVIAADYQFKKKAWSEINTIPRGMISEPVIVVKQPRRR